MDTLTTRTKIPTVLVLDQNTTHKTPAFPPARLSFPTHTHTHTHPPWTDKLTCLQSSQVDGVGEGADPFDRDGANVSDFQEPLGVVGQAQKQRFKLKALYALSDSRVESRSLSIARVSQSLHRLYQEVYERLEG